MDDIVKELRNQGKMFEACLAGYVIARAAAEIERLRLCIRDGVPPSVALDGQPTLSELIESERRNPQTSETAVVAEELTKQADKIERLRAELAVAEKDHRAMEALKTIRAEIGTAEWGCDKDAAEMFREFIDTWYPRIGDILAAAEVKP